MSVWGGSQNDPDHLSGLANFTSNVIQFGSKNFEKDHLKQFTTDKSLWFSAYVTSDATFFRGTCSIEEQNELLARFVDALVNPLCSEEVIKQELIKLDQRNSQSEESDWDKDNSIDQILAHPGSLKKKWPQGDRSFLSA